MPKYIQFNIRKYNNNKTKGLITENKIHIFFFFHLNIKRTKNIKSISIIFK